MTADKRDTDRIPVLGGLHGEVMVFQNITIKEISARGAQIESTAPLQINSLHEFRLTLGDRSIVVKGRVAHCRITDVDQDLVLYRAGIEFTNASERVSAAIANFVDLLKQGRESAL